MKGVPCFLIGNAPSLNDEEIDRLNPYFTIGINRAFMKIDPTILMWQDIELWYTERKKVVRLSAIKVCRNVADPQNRFFHFKLTPGEYSVPEHPGVLHGFGSTGPLAVQLAYTLGCNPIILIGMDCKCRGRVTDFYGKNRHHKPHTIENCHKGLKWVRSEIAGPKILSCGDPDYFDACTLSEAIDGLDPKWKQDRSYYVGLLNR